MAKTPAIKVVLTAPRPGSKTASLPFGGAISNGVSLAIGSPEWFYK
jgi:hypothetical protein